MRIVEFAIAAIIAEITPGWPCRGCRCRAWPCGSGICGRLWCWLADTKLSAGRGGFALGWCCLSRLAGVGNRQLAPFSAVAAKQSAPEPDHVFAKARDTADGGAGEC
jgi:hypothetical protein